MESNLSRSGSRSSSVCELEKDLNDMDILKTRANRRSVMLRTPPARKAKRVRFFRNGDKFYSGVIIPVLPERYRYTFILYLRSTDLNRFSIRILYDTILSRFLKKFHHNDTSCFYATTILNFPGHLTV